MSTINGLIGFNSLRVCVDLNKCEGDDSENAMYSPPWPMLAQKYMMRQNSKTYAQK